MDPIGHCFSQFPSGDKYTPDYNLYVEIKQNKSQPIQIGILGGGWLSGDRVNLTQQQLSQKWISAALICAYIGMELIRYTCTAGIR